MCNHHWYINSQEQGQCLKCGVERTFSKDMDKADGLDKAYYLDRIKFLKKGTGKMNYELSQQGGLPPQIKIATISPQEKYGIIL